MTPRQLRESANAPWPVDAAGRLVVTWAILQARLRDIVRRPYAVVDNKVRPLTDVVYRAPEAMR
jgi:hypothetical protein